MAELSKQALKVQNNTEFPNNNAGLITPSKLRGFNVDMIDSLVDEISYQVDSASWNQQIDSLENFTASLATNFVTTASFNSFTQSFNSFSASVTQSIVDLQNFSASLSGGFVTEGELQAATASLINQINTKLDSASFNSYTQSTDNRLTNIEAATSSYVTSAITASSLVTASVSNDDITFTKGDGSTFTIQVATGSFALSASFAETASLAINALTASIARNLIVIARNGGASTLSAGTVVHITSAVGDNPIFTTASYDTEALSSNTLGILRYSSPSGVDVEVVVAGVVTGVNTDPMLGYTAGDILYLSSSGQFTNVQPQAPNQIVALGQVLRAQQNNGSIYVSINNGWEIDELHNVQIINPQTGDLLQYESSSYGLWKNKSITSAGILSTSSFNSYTQSNDQKVDALIAATGSYATLGANTFNGTQTLSNGAGDKSFKLDASGITATYGQTAIGNFEIAQSGSAVFRGNGAGQFNVLATASFQAAPSIPNITSNLKVDGNFTASLQQGYVWVGDASGVSTTVATSSFGGGSTNTGSLLTTASVNVNVITFTKGDASTFDITVAASGSAPAGTISGSEQITALGFVSSSVTASSLVTASASGNTITFTKGDASTFGIVIPDVSGSTINTGSFATTGSNSFIGNQTINGDVIITGSDSNHLLFGRTGGADILRVGVSDNGNTYDITVTGSTNQTMWLVDNQGGTYINNFTAPIIAGSNVQFQNGFTASLQEGYVWVGNASGKNEPVPTSSFADVPLTSLNAYTQSNDTKWNTLGELTGSYATTGSNVFTGDQTLVDSQGNSVTLSDASGSLMLVAKGYNSSSAHLVASGSSFVNLIFKDNNNTPDTIISGSNNIFPNPAAPSAGFKRFIGSNNLMLNPAAVPQISSSMAFPVNLNANIFSHPLVSSMNIRGPVSSSAYDIRGNIVMHGILNIGQTAANNFEKAQAGLTMFGNSVFGGNIVQVANKTLLTTAPTISNNLLFGAIITLNHNSSSISYTSNVQNGGIVVNNNFSPAVGTTPVALNPKVGINTVYGVGHSLTLDGTNVSTSQTKQFYANILAGLFLSASVPTGDSSNVLGVGMIGNSLTITGSSTVVGASAAYTPNNTQGSLFVGRFNAVDGDKAKTAETVFAVGTGTSTNRKTGFLIDSGSNTFVEGTLNVSGASSLNGNLIITGSLTASLQQGYVWVGDANGITTTVATSSFGGGGAAFPFTGNAVITGSLGISGSMFGGVISLSVVSSTASVDFSAGNMFTLTLPSASTHINPTNIRAGQTVNIQITQPTPGTGSVTFPSNVKFAGGNDYQATTTGSAIDMLTLVSYDGTNVLGTSIKNFL